MKKKYTDEQIDRVNAVNIIDYMAYCGLNLKHSNRRVKVNGWSGLDVTPDGRKWKDFTSGQGGGVIQFVMWLNNMGWKDAVQALLSFLNHAPLTSMIISQPMPSAPAKLFCLPPKAKTYKNIFAYLIKTRKLDPKVVQYCVDQKLLYQDDHGNCVFVGYDDKGKAVSAFLRGSNAYKPFKMEVVGSQDDYGFVLPGTNKRLFIFEATIDLLSYVTLKNRQNPDYFKNRGDHYLSCNGHKYRPILHYLKKQPVIDQIIFAVDNDPVNGYGNRPGQDFMVSAIDEIMRYFPERFTSKKAFMLDLPRAKDWNEELINRSTNDIHQKHNKSRQQCR